LQAWNANGLLLSVFCFFLTPFPFYCFRFVRQCRALHHVTNVGDANFDRSTGEWVGGGLQPDVFCECRQGIPRNVGADFCVGMALDALEDAGFGTPDM
jgi:hypothetical protein